MCRGMCIVCIIYGLYYIATRTREYLLIVLSANASERASQRYAQPGEEYSIMFGARLVILRR